MRRQSLNFVGHAVLVLVLVCAKVSAGVAHDFQPPEKPQKVLENFFSGVDYDGNGEICQEEATKYLESVMEEESLEAGLDQEEAKEDDLSIAELRTRHKLDFNFSYGGNTISSLELEDHLSNMLTGEHVASWVIHGLRLPQYAAAFRDNAIDGLDFPAVVSDNGQALVEELGVSSSLHRNKIHKAIVRQIFGLGRVPGMPRALECKPSACGGVQIQWDPPAALGTPPVHKYLVQRRTRPSAWVDIGDPKDDAYEDDDRDLVAGQPYSYRVQAWGGHGPSEWVSIENCVPAPLAATCPAGKSPAESATVAAPPVTAASAVTVPEAGSKRHHGDRAEEAARRTRRDHEEGARRHGGHHRRSWWWGALFFFVMGYKHGRYCMWQFGTMGAALYGRLKRKYAISSAHPNVVVSLFARAVEVVVFVVLVVGRKARRVQEHLEEQQAALKSAATAAALSGATATAAASMGGAHEWPQRQGGGGGDGGGGGGERNVAEDLGGREAATTPSTPHAVSAREASAGSPFTQPDPSRRWSDGMFSVAADITWQDMLHRVAGRVDAVEEKHHIGGAGLAGGLAGGLSPVSEPGPDDFLLRMEGGDPRYGLPLGLGSPQRGPPFRGEGAGLDGSVPGGNRSSPDVLMLRAASPTMLGSRGHGSAVGGPEEQLRSSDSTGRNNGSVEEPWRQLSGSQSWTSMADPLVHTGSGRHRAPNGLPGEGGSGGGRRRLISHSSSESLGTEEEEEEVLQEQDGSDEHERAAGGGGGAAGELPPALLNAGGGPKLGRYRCNFETCRVRFDRWHTISDWKAAMTKHYCRDCQGVYCVRHTRVSPHGSRGQCGLDSKCLCYTCHARLPPDVQARLERTNKLRVGPVASGDATPPERTGSDVAVHAERERAPPGGGGGGGAAAVGSNSGGSRESAASSSAAAAAAVAAGRDSGGRDSGSRHSDQSASRHSDQSVLSEEALEDHREQLARTQSDTPVRSGSVLPPPARTRSAAKQALGGGGGFPASLGLARERDGRLVGGDFSFPLSASEGGSLPAVHHSAAAARPAVHFVGLDTPQVVQVTESGQGVAAYDGEAPSRGEAYRSWASMGDQDRMGSGAAAGRVPPTEGPYRRGVSSVASTRRSRSKSPTRLFTGKAHSLGGAVSTLFRSDSAAPPAGLTQNQR